AYPGRAEPQPHQDIRRGDQDRGGDEGPRPRDRPDQEDAETLGLRLLAGGSPPDPLQFVRVEAGRLDALCGPGRQDDGGRHGRPPEALARDRAFLVFLTSKRVEITKMQTVVANIVKTSIVVRHLFESKPITPEVLASYDEAVAGELKRLTRILFVEKFGETKEFKKNKEIAQYLQSKLGPLVGPGPLQEIVTMAYNEVGTTAPYMTSAHWERFLTILLDRLREIEGDSVA